MIRVNISNIDSIKTWYKNAVLKELKSKHFSCSPKNYFEKKLKDSLKNDAFCSDVLILSIDEIKNKYDWVKQYIDTIDFLESIPYILIKIKTIKGKGSRKIKERQLTDFIELKRNELIDIILMSFSTISIEDGIHNVCSSMSNFDSFIKVLDNYIGKLNSIIIQKFNYEKVLGKSDIRAQLVMKLNIKVCPYCNRQYINPLTIDKKNIYLGDIDHILPKSRYALFQLSLFNMIPACKACNQLFKKNKTAQILNPYYEGFGDDAFLEIDYSTVNELIGIDDPHDYSWRIIHDKKGKIRNSIDTFQLNEVYKSNSSEFKRILKIKFLIQSQVYRDFIDNLLNSGNSSYIEYFDDTLLYGVSLDENKFQDELLSKAIYDIVMYN